MLNGRKPTVLHSALLTFALRDEVAVLAGEVGHHGLGLVVALLRPGYEPAARGATQPLGNLSGYLIRF